MRTRKIVTLLALSVFALASATRAEATTVMFTTHGEFASSGGSTTTVTSGIHVSSVTFTGVNGIANLGFVGDFSNVSFGTFFTQAGTPTHHYEDDFTLFITQTVPTSGGPLQFQAELTGTLKLNNSQLELEFTTLSGKIHPVLYEIVDAVNTLNYGSTSLEGRVTLIPTPAAAVAGLPLLGILGLRRRRCA